VAKISGSKDVAPKIRGAFKRALLMLEAESKPLSQMIKDSLEGDFLNTLKVISQFTPKEIEQTVERKRSAEDFTDDELLEIASRASGDDSTGTEEGESPVH
jgi:hypothetical protein